MATFKIYFLFPVVSFLLFHSTKSTNPICDKRHCGNSSELFFEFPFQLREENQITNTQSDRCVYPGFEVYCKNNKQPLITLSNGREFVVKHIYHERQRILVEDVNGCKPRRFIQNIDINDDSPFQLDNSYENDHYENVTFLNCTNNVEKEPFDYLSNIPCLSSGNYTIVYTIQSPLINLWNSSCSEIGFAKVPVKNNYGEPMVINDGLNSDILLRWNTPLCKCEADQSCGFLADTGLYVTCYDNNGHFGPPGIILYDTFIFIFHASDSLILRFCLRVWRSGRKGFRGQKYKGKLRDLSHFLKEYFLENDKLGGFQSECSIKSLIDVPFKFTIR